MAATDDPLDAYAAHLASLPPEQLAQVLRSRPDVTWPPLPTDVRELAERLDDPTGLGGSVRALQLPAMQVMVVLLLAGELPRENISSLLGTTADVLQPHLTTLLDRALVWDDGRLIRPAPSLRSTVGSPLTVGRPADLLVAGLTVAQAVKALRGLGAPMPAAQRRDVVIPALREALRDEQLVRATVAAGPAEVRERLLGRWSRATGAARGLDVLAAAATEWRAEQQALTWAAEHGLAFGGYGYLPEVPCEVDLALRPPGTVLPFTPDPPQVATTAVAPETVAAASSAALGELVATTTALLDEVGRGGAALLRKGGVGARELTRLAKTVGADATQVRVSLELAGLLGLFDDDGGQAGPDGGRLTVSAEGEDWRQADPAPRAVSLLAAWLDNGYHLTEPGEDGKPRPALLPLGGCPLCVLGRRAMLAQLGGLERTRATTVQQLAPAARWRAPAGHVGEDGGVLFARPWREAELLGVVAAGALSPLGRLLLVGDLEGLVELVAEVLPSTTEEVLFGADLTAVVPGDPAAAVTRLLDACADREGRGGAVVWRLSPGSVRRALDDGVTGQELLERLEAVSSSGLPQPLRYLVTDVARGHGVLRVRRAVSVVRCDDEPLLAQVCADRALRRLGLALVAPTVATSTSEPEALLAALRGAGYLPMPEGPDGTVTVHRGPSPAEGRRGDASAAGGLRSDALAPLSELLRASGVPDDLSGLEDLEPFGDDAHADAAPVDVDELARRLLGSGAEGPGADSPGGLGARIAALSKRLPAAQRRLLVQALVHHGNVEIDYETAAGTRSTRTLSDVRLVGESVMGWEAAKGDTRLFRVDRIRAVRRLQEP